MFYNKGGRLTGRGNLDYHPLGYYADDPDIDTTGLTRAEVICLVEEEGFTGPKATSNNKKPKAKKTRLPCGDKTCGKIMRVVET